MSKIDPSSVRSSANICRRRVCIIGARGVGKSRAVQSVLPNLLNWRHVVGSDILAANLSRREIGSMSDLDSVGQDVIRQFASEEMRAQASPQLDGFICEGHAAIHSTPSSPVVRAWRRFQAAIGWRSAVGDTIKAFTDLDEAFFNEVILIEARPEIVLERRRKDKTKVRSLHLSDVIEDLQAERNLAAEICRQSGATLRVLDAEIEELLCTTLLRVLTSRGSTVETVAMHHQALVERVASRYQPEFEGQPFFLFDADGTLSPNDVSKILFKVMAPSKWSEAKSNFERSGYNHYSFVLHEHLHVRENVGRLMALAKKLGERLPFSPGVVDCLKEASSRGKVAILTAGIPEVWRVALAREGLADVPVHGLVDFEDRLVMDEQGKETFAAVLKRSGFKVIATGDGKIDTGMLRVADIAFPVFEDPPIFVPGLRDRLRPRRKRGKALKHERLLLLLEDHPCVFQICPSLPITFDGPPPSEFRSLVSDALDVDYADACRDAPARREKILFKFLRGE